MQSPPPSFLNPLVIDFSSFSSRQVSPTSVSCKSRVLRRRARQSFIYMANRPSSQDEDSRLAAELRAKVNQLYGSGSKKRLKTSEDSKNKVYHLKSKDDGEVRQAWIVVASVAVCSVIAGVIFSGLWFGGFVHGKERPERTYHMQYDDIARDDFEIERESVPEEVVPNNSLR